MVASTKKESILFWTDIMGGRIMRKRIRKVKKKRERIQTKRKKVEIGGIEMILLIRTVVLGIRRWLKRSIAKVVGGSDNEDIHKDVRKHKKIRRYYRDFDFDFDSDTSNFSDYESASRQWF